jgi:SAM-dependent MidA family methyltransferase
MAAVSAAGDLLRDEIRREGPVSFHRFMSVALYHPECGYYRRARDPFGKSGDYYTAEQLQPVFGGILRTVIARLFEEMGRPADFTVVELGSGRGEMRDALSEWNYIAVESGRGELPERFRGVVFSNEFFDALPVHVAKVIHGEIREMLVGLEEEQFVCVTGPKARPELEAYFSAYLPYREEGRILEAGLDAIRWMEAISASLESGFVLTVDYGYTSETYDRFSSGTLMSYRRHRASEAVLENPGQQDITAHVCFTALQQHGAKLGMSTVNFERLGQTILRAGEPDRFEALLRGDSPEEELRRRLQLKALLFGMGETFRTLLQRKG